MDCKNRQVVLLCEKTLGCKWVITVWMLGKIELRKANDDWF